MSADADALQIEGVEAPTREEILDLLEDGIRESHRKVKSGRVRDEEKEKVRIKWVRALAYAAGQYRQLRKDQELDDLHEEVAALKRQVEGDHADADGAGAGEVDR